jgi:hypothetical protein
MRAAADRGRFDVLGITGPVLTPTENLDAFKSRVVLHGGVPQASHAGRFVVLAEPVAAGAIGRAFVDGVCPVRVEMDDESHGFADVAAGVTATLRSAASGTAQLLWVQPQEARDDPAIAWTIVRIGGGGGGGSSVAVMFAEVQSASGTTPPYLYAFGKSRTWAGTASARRTAWKSPRPTTSPRSARRARASRPSRWEISSCSGRPAPAGTCSIGTGIAAPTVDRW